MEGGATMLYYTNIDWELTERPFMVVLQLNESEPTGIHTTIVTPAFEATRAVKSVKEANLPNEIQPKFVEWLEDRSPFDVLKTILIQPTTTIDDDDDNNNNNRRRKRQQPIIFVEQNVRLFVFQGISDALLTGKVMMAPRFIRMLRMVKSNSELEIMRCANKVTELAIRTVRPHVKIGMTELDIQRLMENALHTAGLTKTWVLALIDENAALPHGSSSMKKVTGHSSVLIDTGGELLGYQSDCTRTFFMGARGYNQTIEDAWYLVRRAQENVLNHTEANMTCAQVDLTARHIIDKAGYGLYFTHRLGHGIGREMHEEPYMNQGNKAQHLVPGITFSVEPGIYVPQEFGIHYTEDYDDYDDYDDYLDDELNDADMWDTATGDFTKQYNKLRQQIAPSPNTDKPAPVVNRKIAPIAVRSKAGNAQTNSSTADKKQMLESQIDSLGHFASRIHIDDYNPSKISSSVASDIKLSSKKASGDKTIQKDKADRATVEQVLDPRTRIILFKMLNRGIFYEINGCISTGKEANVYHAMTEDGQHRAIKVYKTSILTFKDRDRYVTGEFRFRHGYSKSNPRKMVKVWAEKEMRNLRRLQQAGIPSPNALVLRMHVLVMEFLGDKNGWAYPRLKDANIEASRYPALYYQLVKNIRTIFFSQFFIFFNRYHSRKLYIIDVSQSVEHDHPHASEFLRKDLSNVTDYFAKKDVRVMSVVDLFKFVTDMSFGNEEEEVDARLEKIQEEMNNNPNKEINKTEDEIFVKSYIPTTLEEVIDIERDTLIVEQGKAKNLVYADLLGTGVTSTLEKLNISDDEEKDQDDPISEEEEGNEDESESSSEEDDEEEDKKMKKPRGKKNEDKDEKRERKQKAKEEARERRKHKIPKAEKKRKIKTSSKKKK
ncbi:RIO1 family-domain-containing protein [Cokeromyces recurvatus]|uniref:RIO1 family-domain-containing protein n=1 Tax=Cokeromyces recurvatus TaxID=90255 RepID=UPI00221E4539|nr:RIO1 family-domain-containing protein [Cokeromyces recurvatus]KAI7906912.1 RIO1 family-domain-containing protein [Cokeromyces recurvatus]